MNRGHVYIAYPIDLVTPEDTDYIDDLVGLATGLIKEQGSDVYLPGRAWSVARGTTPIAGYNGSTIQRVNDKALATAHAVLAIWPEGIPSVGVPMEIQRSADLGNPVFVVRGVDTPVTSPTLGQSGIRVYAEKDLEEAAVRAGSQGGGTVGDSDPVAYWTGPPDCAPDVGYPGDAGFDLYNTLEEPLTIAPDELVQIPSGIAVEMPPGTWSLILGRSSTFGKVGLLVNPAVIDNGFRGPLYAVCRNITTEPVTIHPGQRVAQLIPFPLTAAVLTWRHVATLSDSERGTAGFGSTGS